VLLCCVLAALLIAPATASAINHVSFSQVGNLTTPRQNAGAAPLPDGRILIVAGYDSGTFDYLDSAEVFDSKTNTFSPISARLAVGRYAPAVARLGDGRILVAGGQDDNNDDVSSAEVFNPSTGTFSPVGPMATVREEAGAAPLPDGRVMVFGGYAEGPTLSSTEIFDPKTNSFSPGPNLPYATYAPGIAVISGGRILVAGGYDNDGLDNAVIFNPSSSTFAAAGSLPAHTYAPFGASLPGGRALIAGGYDYDVNDYTTRALIFDPATNAFTSNGIGNLIGKREEAATAELPDGRVLVAGGYTNESGSLDSAQVLSVPSNAFTTKLKGRKVKFAVTTEGVAQTTDVSTTVATTAKKKKKNKKPKLVKTTSTHGGPGTIVVKIKLTKQGSARLRQKGKLKVRVTYTPDQGLSATSKLKLRAGK
jgi:Kelch motif protein